jgi:hypothetical protein
MIQHGDKCERSGKWYKQRQCREFSTDGTAMGATIAHLYGTDDDRVIGMIQEAERRMEREAPLTGMLEEQAEWESAGG